MDQHRMPHFRGKAQELLGVGPHHRARPLDELGNERGVESRSALGTRLGLEFLESFQEPLATLRRVEDDVVLFELRLQLFEV